MPKHVLTSSGRLLELPVSLDEMKANEKVVATDCIGGMLSIKEYASGKPSSLHDRQIPLDLSTGAAISFISLPNTDIYLVEKQLLILQNKAIALEAHRNIQQALDMDKTNYDVEV